MALVRVERGQLVLVAAAVIAIGLAPVLFAYLQLGYHPDVENQPEITGEDAVEFLDRSVHDAAAGTAGDHGWADRKTMAEAVRAEIEGDIETLETSRLEDGVSYRVTFADEIAIEWADENCEAGDGKRFGDCVADGGVVLQERTGEAVLLAVAFQVTVIGPDGNSELTVVADFGGNTP